MLAVNFEKNNYKCPGMFHDSVDLITDHKDVPMKFNAFDFHDRLANHDWDLIAAMMRWLPDCYLFVQVTDNEQDSYYRKMREQLGQRSIDLTRRVFVLTKKH